MQSISSRGNAIDLLLTDKRLKVVLRSNIQLCMYVVKITPYSNLAIHLFLLLILIRFFPRVRLVHFHWRWPFRSFLLCFGSSSRLTIGTVNIR